MRRIVLTLSLLLLLGASAPLALGQRGMGQGPSAGPYDPATEVTLHGTVADVTTQTGRRRAAGVHVTLRTGSGLVDVRLGPARYLDEKGLSLAEGDEVTVVGSKVTVAGTEAVIARQVTKGGVTTTLRDERGIPLWSRGRGPR